MTAEHKEETSWVGGADLTAMSAPKAEALAEDIREEEAAGTPVLPRRASR